MSFASEVKEEVTRLELDDRTKKGELSALIKMLSTLSFSGGQIHAKISSKNATVIKLVSQHLQSLYDNHPDLAFVKEERLYRSNIYVLRITDSVREIMNDLDLWSEAGLMTHPRMKFLKNDNMVRGYLMGCFLANGSVNDPVKTNYHLEIKVDDEDHGEFIIKLLQKFYLNARLAPRRNHFIVYIKASEQISDFLRLIGASDAVFEYEDIRIQRDFMNSFSRLNNCEIANDAKSMKVAQEQYEAVGFLIDSGHIAKLSDKDQEMAMLRYKNPEATLMELSRIYSEATGTVLSKSGIRHRFAKIMEMAEKYRG